MSELTDWLRELPVDTTTEQALMDLEYAWLERHPEIRDRVNVSSAQAVVDIDTTMADTAAPRLASRLGRAWILLTELVGMLAVLIALPISVLPSLMEAVSLATAARVAVAAAVLSAACSAVQVPLRRATGDHREGTAGVTGTLAVFTAAQGAVIAVRVVIDDPAGPSPYWLAVAVIVLAAGVHAAAAVAVARLTRRGRRAERPQARRPRPPDRRIRRALARGSRRQRELFGTLSDAERRYLAASYVDAVVELAGAASSPRRSWISPGELRSARPGCR